MVLPGRVDDARAIDAIDVLSAAPAIAPAHRSRTHTPAPHHCAVRRRKAGAQKRLTAGSGGGAALSHATGAAHLSARLGSEHGQNSRPTPYVEHHLSTKQVWVVHDGVPARRHCPMASRVRIRPTAQLSLGRALTYACAGAHTTATIALTYPQHTRTGPQDLDGIHEEILKDEQRQGCRSQGRRSAWLL